MPACVSNLSQHVRPLSFLPCDDAHMRSAHQSAHAFATHYETSSLICNLAPHRFLKTVVTSGEYKEDLAIVPNFSERRRYPYRQAFSSIKTCDEMRHISDDKHAVRYIPMIGNRLRDQSERKVWWGGGISRNVWESGRFPPLLSNNPSASSLPAFLSLALNPSPFTNHSFLRPLQLMTRFH